ncbi:hypothetical protein MRB53_033437 [Persea americana]|uniref:Uncharacterized protein n=1 Tax=Persea americana TaxID=3435 RepID=A0ACC2KV15_PERAE|nr:hypothetical protein MRB53_033437 [Persea americana]
MERSCDYIRTFTQHYRRSERRETGNCSITAAPIGGKVDFPVFLRSERRKARNYSFTAALVGGKPDFPVFLLSKGRKTRNSSFTASPIGGKVDFPVFLRSERRKTGNCIYAAGLATIFGHSRSITAALRGGKLETAALPPLPSAVKSIFQFSSAPRGGKLEITALPPLSSAVNRIFQFSSSPRGGKLEIAALPASPIGGKVDFPVFLRSERRKTGNCIYAAGTCGGKLSIRFFILFPLPLLVGGS